MAAATGSGCCSRGANYPGNTIQSWAKGIHIVMATALLAILPPVLVVVLMQRWFVRGLVESEK